jgi:hypothetical protein
MQIVKIKEMLLRNLLPLPPGYMKQAALSSENLVHINQTIQHHIQEDTDLQSHSCVNIKFCTLFYVCKLIKKFSIMYTEPSSVATYGSFSIYQIQKNNFCIHAVE